MIRRIPMLALLLVACAGRAAGSPGISGETGRSAAFADAAWTEYSRTWSEDAVPLAFFGQVVDGVEWYFTMAGGKATVGDPLLGAPAIPPSAAGRVAVPPVLGGCPVAGIADGAFDGCSGLTSVEVPESVETIGGEAFRGCSGLEELLLPSRFADLAGGLDVPEDCEVAFYGSGAESVPPVESDSVGSSASRRAVSSAAAAPASVASVDLYDQTGYYDTFGTAALRGAAKDGDDDAVSVYRFYSKNYKGHFFTINEGEKTSLILTNPNWKYEGVAYRAFKNAKEGTTPLYRFYSKSYKGHFFTINEQEMWTVRLTNPNWKYEGVAYHVYASEVSGSVPVYRFWSKNYRHHFFTVNEGEMWTLRLSNPNWKYEGVAFWALPSAGGGEPSQYMVVDLSGGPSATSYPVAYLAEPPSGGFNTDEYKTAKLVLRRLEPGPIPTRDAMITKPFYVGLFEVTQRQWELVTGTRPSYFSNASYYATRPVEQVSYDMIRGSSAGSRWPASNGVDAGSFLGKLRARTGLVFDLPTEAQWEYACRAGTTTDFNNGKNCTNPDDQDSALGEVGRYWSNGGSDESASCTTAYGTAAVGSYHPNAWGLYDMHGNVWEWCLDWYGDSLSGNDPVGSSSAVCRVLRGGGWCSDPYWCTSSYRDAGYPSDAGWSDGSAGFRLAGTPRSYTISFDSAGGSAVASVTAPCGSALTAPAAPTRDGYMFAGWSPAFPPTMPLGGATLTALWTPEGVLSWDVSGGTVTITGTQQNPIGDLVIPAEIDGLPVTHIVDDAFSGCTGLTSVTIPDSVTRIGWEAFSGCSRLMSITIGNGVMHIEDGAFAGCSGLTSLVVPDSVTSVGEDAFYRCSGLVSISVGVNNASYSSANGLLLSKDETTLVFGVNGAVAIPDGVTSIMSGAFRGCSGLTSVMIPGSVTSIGSYAFSGCSGLTTITIPDGVTSIMSGAFRDCSGLTSIMIPGCVTNIGSYSFYGCSGLTSITIPDCVTSISEKAFYNCSGLTTITIPDSVTSIGSSAFDGCSGLTSLSLPGRFRGNTSNMGIPSGCTVTFRV